MTPIRLATALLFLSTPAFACTTNLAVSATSTMEGGMHRVAITLTNTSDQNFLSHIYGQRVEVSVQGVVLQTIVFEQVFVGQPVTLIAELPADDHINRARVEVWFNPRNPNDAYPNDDCVAGDNSTAVRLQ